MQPREPREPSRVSGADRPTTLAELVAQVLERLEREGPPALEELCGAHPAHATALRARVEQLRAIGFVGAPPKDAPLPERIGGFRVLGRLGGGGMGVVLLAEQEGLARLVALKLVRPDLLYFPGARERFRREVEAVARLAHPGIVPVFAGGEDNGIPYYAMERVRGASLEELLTALAGRDPSRLSGPQLQRAVELLVRRRERAADAPDAAPGSAARASDPVGVSVGGRSSAAGAGGSSSGTSSHSGAAALFAGTWTAACLRVAGAVAGALQHAHEQGVLHRDVKPSNIMLTPDGRVLLLDFGLAAAEGSERLTGSGAQLGSLAWMSPEQVRGEHGELDARTDVYSLGATLYELLTLRSPFTGGDAETTRRRILDGQLIPLRDLNAAAPRDAETVCLHAMSVERERRYADAAAFAEDIDNVLALRPVAARRPGPALKVRRWAQRNPARAVASVLGAVLLVGGPVGYGVLQSRAADEQHRLNDELTAGRTALQQSLAEETRQRQASERGYLRTLDAVDQMLSEVGASDLQDLPGFEDTRIALLERALGFYRDLASEAPADVVPLREHARAQRSTALILIELGRRDEAGALLDTTVATLRDLLAQQPQDTDLQHLLSSTLALWGNCALETGSLSDAQARYAEALALLEALAARSEPDPGWLYDKATVLVNLALVARDTGRDEDMLALCLRSADVAARIVAEHPDSLLYAIRAAHSLKDAGDAALQLGRTDDAERLYREAHAGLLRLWPDNQRSRELRADLIESGNGLGLLLMSRADRTEALAVLRAGLDAARSLSDEFPRNPRYRRDAAVLGINVSSELGNQKRIAEATPIIEASVADLQQLVANGSTDVQNLVFLGAALSVASGMHLLLGDAPRARREVEDAVARLGEARAAMGSSNEVADQLASAMYQLADVHRAEGGYDEALGVCEQAAALGGGRPDILFQGAEIAGHLAVDARAAAAHAASADGADAARELDIAARAEELALALLGDAIERGFTDRARLRADVFATLQDLPAFESLVERAGASP